MNRSTIRKNKVSFKKKTDQVMYLYGRIGERKYAIGYCDLHKCYIDKRNMLLKSFKCEKCKNFKEINCETNR